MEVGVKPVAEKDAKDVVEKLLREGEGLVMLDATIFELSLEDVENVLDGLEKLNVSTLAVGLEG